MPIISRPGINPSNRTNTSNRHNASNRTNPTDRDPRNDAPSKWARGPSGPWTRLKSAPRDDLTVYGFPSKGETRLNDFKAQELFFRHIFERYMLFCHESRTDLAKEFGRLNVQGDSILERHVAERSSPTVETQPPKPPGSAHGKDANPELVLIHTAMRKLREALLSSHRADDFARSTYLFIARAAMLSKSWEAYVPALNHLTHTIHKSSPLSPSDWKAVTCYQILDLACRQRDFHQAYILRKQRGLKDPVVDRILNALVRDDWVVYWDMKGKVDGYMRAVMEFAEDGVRVQALKSLARTYFDVEKSFVEKSAGKSWDDLVKEGVGWELVDRAGKEVVVIRRAKGK